MKIRNIKFTANAIFSNGEMKIKYFVTEQAMSKWANAQFRKDENVTVEVWNGFSIDGKKYCTYHA